MKKTLSLILVFLLCLSLCACNVNNDNPTTPSTEPSEAETTGATETTETTEPLPFSGVTVSIPAYSDTELDDLWIYRVIEEKFSCNIEVIEIDPKVNSYDEIMAALLAENKLPTIFNVSPGYYSEPFLPIEQIIELGEQGKFVDVMAPENLEKMPNFASIFADNAQVNQEYMMTAAEDRSHYILPAYDLERDVNHYWVYNEVAFKKAGVEWAGDPDGFLDMLRKLKAYYPDSWPLTGQSWAGLLDRVCFTWGVNSSYAAYDWDKGEWFYGATTDAYYDMLDMFQTAYNESLMHPGTLTSGSGSIQSDITSGQSFLYNSWLGWMTAHNDAFIAGEWDMHEVPAPTPVGPNGKTLEVKKFKNNAGTIISNQDPEAAACAMAIMDWMYDTSEDGGAWLNTVGDETMLTTDENGRYLWIAEDHPYFPDDDTTTDVNYVSEKYGMFHQALTVRRCPESPYFTYSAEEQLAQEIGDKVGYFRAPPTLPSMDSETAETYAAAQAEIKNMQIKFITENWDRETFVTWAEQFNETYGSVIDYLNS